MQNNLGLVTFDGEIFPETVNDGTLVCLIYRFATVVYDFYLMYL